jgi:hypothetical protein
MGIKNGRATSGNTEYNYTNPSSDFIGKIVEMHTFGGTVPIPRGYMICNGNAINEANYNAVHGAGAYQQDGISVSPLLGKLLPNMVNRYSVGAASTPQDGSVAITTTGNVNHQVSLAHSHTVSAHNHQWLDYANEVETKTYNSGGSAITLASVADTSNPSDSEYNIRLTIQSETSTRYPIADLYTNNDSPGTNSQLSASQSIKPESIEVIKLIRVI